MNLSKMSIITGLIVSIITIGIFVGKIDSRYAKSKEVEVIKIEVQQTGYRLDTKIKRDRLYDLQNRTWKLEDRYGSIDEMPQEIKHEYRILKEEIEQIKKELSKDQE